MPTVHEPLTYTLEYSVDGEAMKRCSVVVCSNPNSRSIFMYWLLYVEYFGLDPRYVYININRCVLAPSYIIHTKCEKLRQSPNACRQLPNARSQPFHSILTGTQHAETFCRHRLCTFLRKHYRDTQKKSLRNPPQTRIRKGLQHAIGTCSLRSFVVSKRLSMDPAINGKLCKGSS